MKSFIFSLLSLVLSLTIIFTPFFPTKKKSLIGKFYFILMLRMIKLKWAFLLCSNKVPFAFELD